MARPRAAAYDDQRDQILQRAAQLFASRGYTATTMNDVAQACGVSKALLYHYVPDKHALLATVALAHVSRLEAVIKAVRADAAHASAQSGSRPAAQSEPAELLHQLILRFVQAYASAQHEHRVLTEDVRFLDTAERTRVLAAQRRIVAAFADAVAAVRPELTRAALAKPVTMLLFGMINWMYTWMRPNGQLTHAQIAPLVADLFIGGLAHLTTPAASAISSAAPRRAPRQATTPRGAPR